MRKKIALFLAAMLIFCAFGTDSVTACYKVYPQLNSVDMQVLETPEAGEFFTGSLPEGERQSVREVVTDWQSTVAVRTGRMTGTKSGPKEQEK